MSKQQILQLFCQQSNLLLQIYCNELGKFVVLECQIKPNPYSLLCVIFLVLIMALYELNYFITVINSYFFRDFLPRGSGIVTRRPLILQLNYVEKGGQLLIHLLGTLFLLLGNHFFVLWYILR